MGMGDFFQAGGAMTAWTFTYDQVIAALKAHTESMPAYDAQRIPVLFMKFLHSPEAAKLRATPYGEQQ